MILFHGGTQPVERPVIIAGEQGRDFGFAFYATDIREQAERWAARRAKYFARMPGRSAKGIVSVYEFNENDVSGLSVLEFPEPSLEWIDFVVKCRSDVTFRHGYDIVSGKVANDRVGETISYVVQGVMRREDALERLKFQRINNQFAFCSERAIAKLKFSGSYGVDNV